MTAEIHNLPHTDRFLELWDMWPRERRVRKRICKRKWDEITGVGHATKILDKSSNTFFSDVLQATPEEILDGAERYLVQFKDKFGYWKWIDGDPTGWQYVQMLQTWLNQGGWEDC